METMLLRLMDLLTGRAPAFEAVENYLKDDLEGRKRYQLAQRLAHLFDQYLIYRPTMLLRWERGDTRPGEEWQAALWRELAAGTDNANPMRLREQFGNALLSSLGNQGRDFLNVLLDGTDFDSVDVSSAPEADSILHRVQADVFRLSEIGVATKQQISRSDDSIQLHSCHSPLRELEVL